MKFLSQATTPTCTLTFPLAKRWYQFMHKTLNSSSLLPDIWERINEDLRKDEKIQELELAVLFEATAKLFI
jgi:hypothetical protein